MASTGPAMGSGPGLTIDLSRGIPNARRVWLTFAIGTDAFLLLALFGIFPPSRIAATFSGMPIHSYDPPTILFFLALIGFVAVFGAWMSRGQTGEQMVVDDRGVRIERAGKVRYDFPWTGGKTPLVLGDVRIDKEQARAAYNTPGLPPPPLKTTPPDGAFILAPLSVMGMIRLPDLAYKALLSEADHRGISTVRSVDYYVIGHGTHVYYVRQAFQRPG